MSADGRRPSGPPQLVSVAMSPDLVRQIEAWAAAQPDTPARAAAIRRLVEGALAGQNGGMAEKAPR